MAGTQIKEYIIKIRAEVDEAKREIDKLGQSFKHIDPKGGFSEDLAKQTEKITGFIGTLTDKMNEMQNSMNKVNSDKITSEFKNAASELKSSVDDIKKSFDSFTNTIKGLTGDTQGIDFGKVFSDFTEQINLLISSYKDAMETIQSIMTGGIDQKELQKGLSLKIPTKLINKEIVDFEGALDNAINSFNKKKEQINKALGEGFDETSSQQWGEFSAVVEPLKQMIDEAEKQGRRLEDIYARIGDSQQSFNERIVKGVRRAVKISTDGQPVNELVDAANNKRTEQRNAAKNAAPITIPLNVEINKDQFSEEAISRLVNEISTNIQTKVHERLEKEPIQIPLDFGQSLQVNTDDIVDQVNTKIKEVNSSDQLAKIEVDIVPRDITGNIEKVNDIAEEIEQKIIERYSDLGEEGVGVNIAGGNITIDAKGISTEKTLSAILGILQGWDGGDRNNNRLPIIPPSTPPSSGGGGNGRNVIPPVGQQSNRSQTSPQNIPPTPPKTTPTQTVNTVITGQDKPIETVADKKTARIGRRFVGPTTRGMKPSGELIGQISERKRSELSWNATFQEQQGIKQLSTLIKDNKKTIDDLKSSDIYNKAYSFRDQRMASFGGDREELSVFQNRLAETFERGKAEIARGTKEIEAKFSDQVLKQTGLY